MADGEVNEMSYLPRTPAPPGRKPLPKKSGTGTSLKTSPFFQKAPVVLILIYHSPMLKKRSMAIFGKLPIF